MSSADLREKREATVLEHFEAERRGDFDAALATFARPRYELPGGEIVDGADAVAAYYDELAAALPDLSAPDPGDGTVLHHGADAVIMETILLGTQKGPVRGLPPTGRRIEIPLVAIFDFEADELVCERVFFDRLQLLQQLGVAHDPDSLAGRLTTLLTHPVTMARAVLRSRGSQKG